MELEEILKLMIKYRVKSVKVGDITVDGLELPMIQEDDLAQEPEEVDEDILFYSAGN